VGNRGAMTTRNLAILALVIAVIVLLIILL
jgi:hypothetical protein